MTKTKFIDFMASLIKKHASDYGICVISPIISKACKESAFGTSELGDYSDYKEIVAEVPEWYQFKKI